MKPQTRFWELDALKGIAIILVVIFHAVFDLSCFTSCAIDCTSFFWQSIARTAASLFIFTSGISLALSINKAQHRSSYKRIYIRALKLFGIASIITLTTAVLFQEGTIVFGILHFLATASIISIPFYQLGMYNFLVACTIFAASFITETITVSSSCFVWLGIAPQHFSTFDYFPLIPWLGVYLVGLSMGKLLYVINQQTMPAKPKNIVINSLGFLGRHTLLIYLIHQPILFAFGYFLL